LVGNSFVNHELFNVASSDYRLIDRLLLRNNSLYFDSNLVRQVEARIRSRHYVFYNFQPFAHELLTRAMAVYKPALDLSVNNPQCIYFNDGLLYARK
jgi:hypothetical protein